MSRYCEWDLSCKLYVGNLGSNATKHEIESAFSKYGPLRNVWVSRNPPGFAFVEFDDSRDAEDAVRGLNGTRCCGTRVRVKMSSGRSRLAARRPGPRYSRSRSRSPRKKSLGRYPRSLSRSPRRSPLIRNSRSRSRSPRRRSLTRSRSRDRRSRSDSRDRRAASSVRVVRIDVADVSSEVIERTRKKIDRSISVSSESI